MSVFSKAAEYALVLAGGVYKVLEAFGWLSDRLQISTDRQKMWGFIAEETFRKAAAMSDLAGASWDVMTARSLAATGAAQVAVAAEEEVITKGAKAATSVNAYWDALFMQQSARRNKDKEQTAQMAVDAVTWQNWQTESILAKMVEEAAVRQHNRNVELTKEQQLEAKKVQVKQIAAGMISGTIAALATFGSRAARAAFILEKGYAIATAICNTALGVTKC